ncbi:MAG TPA: hypothetical protein VN452_07415 [Longilinea sp.]|nr:hypothetical protein [Longilinea sp.]
MKKTISCLSFAILGIVFLLIIGLVGYQTISGRNLELGSKAWLLTSQVRVILTADRFRGQQDGLFNNIIFVHRSVGKGMLDQGKLRETLTASGFQVWDQGYRVEGLWDPAGNNTGLTYFIPGDNTDPDGLYELFMQTISSIPINGLSELFLHDVIIIKSCFTVSDIGDDAKLEADKQYYRAISTVMGQHPEKLFILLTQPPRNPAETDAASARRARELASWLVSDEFIQGHANIKVFNLFDLLAEPDQSPADANTLRTNFRNGTDSHPNDAGSLAAGQKFAEFVIQAASTYQADYSAK